MKNQHSVPISHMSKQEPVLFMPQWGYKAIIATILMSASSYIGFALWSGWNQVIYSLNQVGFSGILIALALSLTNYLLRFVRWRTYLHALGHPLAWWITLKAYIAGFSMAITPGKAGESLRGVLIRPYGVPYTKSFAAFFSERISDMLAIILLTSLSLSSYPKAQPLVVTAIVLVLSVFIILSCHKILAKLHKTIRVRNKFSSLLQSLLGVLIECKHCNSPKILAIATGLSLIAWSAEAYGFYLLTQWVGLSEISFLFGVFTYALATLAGSLILTPGGLGGTEAVMISLLMLKGSSSAEAISVTVLIRLATLWFALILGSIALFDFFKKDKEIFFRS